MASRRASPSRPCPHGTEAANKVLTLGDSEGFRECVMLCRRGGMYIFVLASGHFERGHFERLCRVAVYLVWEGSPYSCGKGLGLQLWEEFCWGKDIKDIIFLQG